MNRGILFSLLLSIGGLIGFMNTTANQKSITKADEANRQNIIYSNDTIYKKIASVDELTYGDQIILVTNYDKTVAMSNTYVDASTDHFNATTSECLGDYAYLKDDTNPFAVFTLLDPKDSILKDKTIEYDESYQYCLSSDGTTNSLLSMAGGSISLTPRKYSSSILANNPTRALWKIAILEDGTMKISAKDQISTSTSYSEKYIQYNSSSNTKYFSGYANTQKDVDIYKAYSNYSFEISDDLTSFAKSSIEKLNVECNIKSVSEYTWASIVSDYGSLSLSENDKAALKSGVGVGYDINPNASYIQDFIAKYDLITERYGYDKFITYRNVSNNLANSSYIGLNNNITSSNNAILTYVVIGLSIVILVATTKIVIKKRKE